MSLAEARRQKVAPPLIVWLFLDGGLPRSRIERNRRVASCDLYSLCTCSFVQSEQQTKKPL